jgi:retinoblastoma-like protein 1
MSPVRGPSAFSAFSSPQKSRLMPPLLSAFASPQRPNPHAGGETFADTSIKVFFQKVSKLAAVRIQFLCGRLQQAQQVADHVLHALNHALNHETSLFFNRHIDQVILCCLYGICKVSKANVAFRDIIYHYRKQPQCKPYVFRNVLLDAAVNKNVGKVGQARTGDIIKFYNEVFVPSTKSFLLHLGSNAGLSVPKNIAVPEERNLLEAQAPASPSPSTFPALPDMSPKKVSAKHNVYVSPLPSNKVDSIMSPHTRSLYACVGESTQAYQSPSKDLTDINNRLNNRRLGRLDFGAAAVVSDSLVANTLSILNGNGNSHSIRPKADSTIPRSWSPSKRSRSDR